MNPRTLSGSRPPFAKTTATYGTKIAKTAGIAATHPRWLMNRRIVRPKQTARNAITGITLIAGFASTVGWPVTTLIDTHYGWRTACLFWAVVHMALALRLNFWLPRLSAAPLWS